MRKNNVLQVALARPRRSSSLNEVEPYRPVPGIELWCGDSLSLYPRWPAPTVIISDGAYGVRGFDGDPPTSEGLREWYAPHIAAWSRHSTPETTLWFWNTELGWATVHPLLADHGWEYRACHVWDKGLAHVAGNCNTGTLRKLPIVSEVCVQYTRQVRFPSGLGTLPMKEWLRAEWERSGLPLYLTNVACDVRNAATRKYFTKDHLWYFPPPDAFSALVRYANQRGRPEGQPYFSIDGRRSLTGEEWARMRAKFHCPVGVSNVWQEPAVRGDERVKIGHRAAHLNQKPLRLMQLAIELSSDPADLVWEPFGGLFTGMLAAHSLGRRGHAAEVDRDFFSAGVGRFSR